MPPSQSEPAAVTTAGRTQRATLRVDPGEAVAIALLLALAVIGWVVTDERMAGWIRARHGPRVARLLRHRLGGDDGGDDVPVDRADGRDVQAHPGRRERGAAAVPGGTALFVSGYMVTGPRRGCSATWVIKAGRGGSRSERWVETRRARTWPAG